MWLRSFNYNSTTFKAFLNFLRVCAEQVREQKDPVSEERDHVGVLPSTPRRRRHPRSEPSSEESIFGASQNR